jgi:beta-N-acetylhexosaminidase
LVASPLREFADELQSLLPGASIVRLRRVPSRKHRQRELEALAEKASRHRLTVVAVVNAYQAWLVQKLRHRTRRPLVAVSFASPYYLRNFPAVDGYLCAYSYLVSAQRAAARAVAGHTSVTGRLPVSVSRNYPRGHGLFLPSRSCTAAARR